MSTGYVAENELWNWFMDNGYASLRAPTSGGSTKRISPDLVALKRKNVTYPNSQDTPEFETECHAIEVKKRDDGTVSLSTEEVLDLDKWATRAGGTAWIVVKPDLRTFDSWLCMEVDDLHKVESGNFSIRKQDHDQCLSLKQAFL